MTIRLHKLHKRTKNYNDYNFQYNAMPRTFVHILVADVEGFSKYQEWYNPLRERRPKGEQLGKSVDGG